MKKVLLTLRDTLKVLLILFIVAFILKLTGLAVFACFIVIIAWYVLLTDS